MTACGISIDEFWGKYMDRLVIELFMVKYTLPATVLTLTKRLDTIIKTRLLDNLSKQMWVTQI